MLTVGLNVKKLIVFSRFKQRIGSRDFCDIQKFNVVIVIMKINDNDDDEEDDNDDDDDDDDKIMVTDN